MTKEFCDICGRPIETHKNVSEFKLKKAVHTLRESWWQKLTVHLWLTISIVLSEARLRSGRKMELSIS